MSNDPGVSIAARDVRAFACAVADACAALAREEKAQLETVSDGQK
jgi:hypothetical protein